MRDFQLGDYKGGRDNILPLMNAEIPQLQNLNQAALNFGSIGLQSMAQKHALGLKADNELRNALILQDNTLSNQMGLAEMKHAYDVEAQQVLKEAAMAKATEQEAQAQDLIAGGEQAMLDWAANVLQQYEPDSPEFKQAQKTYQMLKNRKKGSAAYNKGYLSFTDEHDVGNMISQGSLGAAGWQQAQKPTPAANKKPLPKPSPKGYELDSDLHT